MGGLWLLVGFVWNIRYSIQVMLKILLTALICFLAQAPDRATKQFRLERIVRRQLS
jgi:hypothetical protein